MTKLELRQSKKECGETLSLLKSVQLDFKIANKDLKLKEDKLSDLKKEMNDL